MNARWKEAIDRGLGDSKTRALGILLILAGVLGKLVFLRFFANIETIFAVSIVAGSVLGRWWTVLVPIVSLAIVEPFLWGGPYASYATDVVLGLTFFIVTGFVFVGLFGRGIKPHVLFRVRGVALLTTVSVPLTIAYDLWTDVGEYFFIAKPMGLTFWNVLEAQPVFTVYHLLSSLIFVPLFGAGIFYLSHVLWPSAESAAKPSDERSPAKEP